MQHQSLYISLFATILHAIATANQDFFAFLKSNSNQISFSEDSCGSLISSLWLSWYKICKCISFASYDQKNYSSFYFFLHFQTEVRCSDCSKRIIKTSRGTQTDTRTQTGFVSPSSHTVLLFPVGSDVTEGAVLDQPDNSSVDVSESQGSSYGPTSSDGSQSLSSNESEVDWKIKDQCHPAVSEPKFIIFRSCLFMLLSMIVCEQCSAPMMVINVSVIRSLLVVTLTCGNNHNFVWHSQPMFGRMASGNLLISGAVLFTGNTFLKTEEFCRHLNLPILGKSQ